jgi:glycosyltransferase involved in cell wall biosynthesis
MVVSVVCISHNQAAFLREAVQSILQQTYSSLDIWLVDDASSDACPQIIRELNKEFPQLNVFMSDTPMGNTKIFNAVFPKLRGEYVIDLAADDILLPERVEEGVRALAENTTCGVNFTNAEIIDERGNFLRHHYPVDRRGKSTVSVPEGFIFHHLISSYFLNPVTMMIRRTVLEQLGGYDDTLSYEDFDFWVRSSREFPYCYTDKVLVQKRTHSSNMSSRQYTYRSIQMRDTYKICRKIKALIRNPEEQRAYEKRLGFEMRQCLRTGNVRLLFRYLMLF